jgi:hypothetical protein
MKAGAGKLPTATHAVIKRAKKAIQKLLLNTDASKTETLKATAEIEMANADKHCGDRKYWREEVLITSNQPFCQSIPNTSWYCKVRAVQWSLTKIPEWAKNGKDEPNAGEMIEGKPYVNPPPYQSR